MLDAMMISENSLTLITAIVTPLGLIAVAAINYLTSIRAARDARSAQASAKSAEAATLKAADDAAKARDEVMANNARQTASAHAVAASLTDIADTTHVIHTIVNSQHTKLLQLVANLTSRVASDNPHDVQAQRDAREAESAIEKPGLHGVQVKEVDLTKA